MTCNADAIVGGRWCQLIVRPLVERSPIVRRLVHRVAGEAGQRPLRVGRVLEARRFDQAVVLAAGGADHAVGPEDVAYESRVGCDELLHPRRVEVGRRLNDQPIGGEIVAGAIGESARVCATLAFYVGELPEGMALTADLRSTGRVQTLRLDEGRVRRAGEVQRVSPPRIPIARRV